MGTEQPPPALALPSLCHGPGVAPRVTLSPDLGILVWEWNGAEFLPQASSLHSLLPVSCPREKEQPKVGVFPSSGSLFSGPLAGCTILEATIVLCPGFAEENLASGPRWNRGIQAEASPRVFGHF